MQSLSLVQVYVVGLKLRLKDTTTLPSLHLLSSAYVDVHNAGKVATVGIMCFYLIR